MKRIRTFLSLLIIVGGIFAAPIQTMAATNINGTPSVASSQSKGDLPSIDQAQSSKSKFASSAKTNDIPQNVTKNENKVSQKASNELGNNEGVRGPSSSIDITISNSKLTTNSIEGGFGTTEFKFDFSVPDSAKSGDTTTISLPDQLDFQRSQKFNIYAPDGKTVVATAVIDKPSKSLVLTYTDYVDSHDSISGHIDMQVTAATSEVNKEETIPAEIKINGHTVTIDSSGIKHRPSRGDTATDFWKYGYVDYDKNEVVYHVNINASMQSVSNVVISDSLVSDGFSYVPGSFSISKGNWERNSENYWTLSNPQDVTNQYNIDINSSNSAYTVKLGNISEGYAIVYRVKSNHPLLNGEQVVNNVNYESNKKVINSSKNTVYYQGASGKANGYNHSLTINKEDESGAPLANAVFSVIRKSTNGVVGTITTGPDGKGTIYGLLKDDYIIRETSAPSGYTLAKDVTVSADSFDSKGATATITDKKAVTTVSGTKTWKDNDDQDGKRPDSIKVNLLANGKVVQSKTVTASDNWKYSFTNLPEFENGKKISYTVTEDQVKDYSTTVDGYNLTNSYTPAKTSVSVTKAWNDNNNQDGSRPNEVKVQLYANGEKSGNEVTLNAANKWTHTWTELAEKSNKKTVQYSVKEVGTVKGYTSSVNGKNGNFTVTNTHTPSTTTVSGTKTWKDNNDQDGKRPDSIKVNLLANGKVVQSKTVKASDNWKYSFTNLPEFENGKKISYTVTEDQVKDYSTTVNGYNLTNSYTPAKTSVSVTKAWNDNNNQDGSRPNEVKVQLYANGEKSGNEVTLNAANKWTHTWTELAEKSNKKTVQYSVKEVGTVKGYTSSVNGKNGNFIVTNTHTPSTTTVSGTKTWKDNDDQDGKRPDSIKVNLLANGKVVQSKTVKASDNWKYSFTNLPEFENGKKISYTVTEDQVKDYSTTVNGYNLTNSYTPAKTSVSVTKAWNDNNNQDGSRPNEVKVQLYANGEKSGNEVTLNAANKWTHTWTELAEKSNKKTVQYSVKEVGTVKGYTSSVNGKNGNFIVTNTHTPSTPNVPTNKTPNKSSRHNNPIKKIVQKIVQLILPQTGSSSETYLIAIGGVLLILLLSVILLKRKKK
ncbi:Cna B-type domain-containing protein [Lactobacillus gasseri]|uniref:Cna B-type domain-containing protein n=9 Tax=Bacillati TaxID=1783272 RepID=UPI00386A844E